MITIQNLSKKYKRNFYALKGIDLEIGTGMFGLLGPNGAGKTTLMRILAGLIRPTGGSVVTLGHDVTTRQGKHVIQSHLGYLPQELGLYPNLTGREFLDYVGVLKGITDKTQRQLQVDEALELVRLTDVQTRRIKKYSGGMKRRIGIAQAIMGNPKLLIVDEPTAGLDPEERIRFRNVLSEMAERCTVILSTHIVEDISHSCQALAVLNEGQLKFVGSPHDLIAQAEGRTWHMLGNGKRPSGDLTIISTRQQQDGTMYRVVGQPAEMQSAQQATPTLEDGYIWLMRQTETSS